MTHHPPDTHHYFRFRKTVWRIRREGVRRLLARAARRAVNPAWFAGFFLWAAGCALSSAFPTPTPTPVPTATPAPAANGWDVLAPGLERRVYTPPDGFFTRLTVLRIDPAQFAFRVHYRPGAPLYADGWRDELPEAAAIWNANFFDRTDHITGMLFTDGVQFGQPYRRRGGTFFVNGSTAGIQSNLVQSYNGEQYAQAVQAFPMLVTNGQQSYFDNRADRTSRRTVIAVDTQGRVLVMVTTFGGITLLDLAEYLPTTDMDIVDALNLDGGGSSLLDIHTDASDTTFTSFDPVPAVVAVYPR